MKPFEIYYWQPPGWRDPHPCVIVSHPDRASRRDPVEVLACSTARANRKPGPDEILLDEADGLDWPTICKCDVIFAAARADIKAKKGEVTDARRRPLVTTLLSAHNWPAWL